MKVLQINSSDVIGGRFNNFELRGRLAEEGIESRHLVWTKLSDGPASDRFANLPGSRLVNRAIGKAEQRFSVHSRLQLQSFATPLHRAFREAEVVHYHIVHDGFFSLDALPYLTRLKPSVWTWHDPWIMTGHCIYPLACDRWKTGCGACPRLDLPFKMRTDRSADQFSWKAGLLRRVCAQIIVASQYMRNFAEQSPIARGMPIRVVPFGIDLNRFRHDDSDGARRRLGVLPGRLVIGVRAFSDSPFKGFEFFKDALRRLGRLGTPLTILTTHDKGQLDEFIGAHQIIDLGWVNDERTITDTFMATDLFVMPSTAEAFGMMAIEAMACAKPIIIFDGTSLSEVTNAPEIGVAVAAGDSMGLAAAMRRLIDSPAERLARGAAGRAFAEVNNSDKLFASRLADIYREVAKR